MPVIAAANPPDVTVRVGPPAKLFLGNFFEFNRDRVGFLMKLAQEYGDLVPFRLGAYNAVLINHPDYIRDVLTINHTKFHKGRALARAKRLIGEGLLTSEEEFHLRQRRLMQPAFHRQRIATYAEAMVEQAARIRQTWQDDAVVDIRDEMTRLTLGIVCQVLLGADVEDDAGEVGRAFSDIMELATFCSFPSPNISKSCPCRSRCASGALVPDWTASSTGSSATDDRRGMIAGTSSPCCWLPKTREQEPVV